MTGEPTEIETAPEIVAVEHPEPHIVGEPEPAEPVNEDQAADEDEDRKAGLGSTLADKQAAAADAPVEGQLTIEDVPETAEAIALRLTAQKQGTAEAEEAEQREPRTPIEPD